MSGSKYIWGIYLKGNYVYVDVLLDYVNFVWKGVCNKGTTIGIFNFLSKMNV